MPIRHPVAFPKGHIVTALEWIADHTLPTEAELGSILDGRYVNVTGDTMIIQAADTFALYIDQSTNPYSGVATNYGVDLRKDIAAGSTGTAFMSYGFNFLVRNYRDFAPFIGSMSTIGIVGQVEDYGDLTGAGIIANRVLDGVRCLSYFMGDDLRAGNTGISVRGAYFETAIFGTVNKASGTLTLDMRGIDVKVDSSVLSLLAGTLVANLYGARISATGTTLGTQTVYGVYASAIGGDVNWAGYFVNADVYIEQGLEIDGALDLDGSINAEDIDVIGAGAGAYVTSIPVTAAGVTGYIYVYSTA